MRKINTNWFLSSLILLFYYPSVFAQKYEGFKIGMNFGFVKFTFAEDDILPVYSNLQPGGSLAAAFKYSLNANIDLIFEPELSLTGYRHRIISYGQIGTFVSTNSRLDLGLNCLIAKRKELRFSNKKKYNLQGAGGIFTDLNLTAWHRFSKNYNNNKDFTRRGNGGFLIDFGFQKVKKSPCFYGFRASFGLFDTLLPDKYANEDENKAYTRVFEVYLLKKIKGAKKGRRT